MDDTRRPDRDVSERDPLFSQRSLTFRCERIPGDLRKMVSSNAGADTRRAEAFCIVARKVFPALR